MTFPTPEFWSFLAATCLLVAFTRGSLRKCVLLLASYIFYASWDERFVALLVGSTLVDFFVGQRLRLAQSAVSRRRLLALSLCCNLGALAYFKYAGFFLESAIGGLHAAGLSVAPQTLKIVLPVGISFYTFQTLSYTIDVYRRRITDRPSLLDFATYVAFFPQLVAGPIERASHFLPQLKQACSGPAWPHLLNGFGWRLIAWGCLKKVVADHYAELLDPIFDDVAGAHPMALWVGVYAFSIQIYLDFSGYTDTAIGLGKILGFDISPNFRAPYGAAGPSDFWRRWHISLSTWLRDYLYVSLGGSRGSRWLTRKNLLLTMLLGGLWHGAAWNFVLWGAFHGGLLLLARMPPFVQLGEKRSMPWLVFRKVLWFHLVCLGWALFRASSLGECALLWRKLLDPFGFQVAAWLGGLLRSGEAGHLLVMGGVAALLVGSHQLNQTPQELLRRLEHAPALGRYGFTGFAFFAAAVLAQENPPLFIYFQF